MPKAKKSTAVAKKPMGRPSSYTKETGDRICELMGTGRSLRSIIREEPGMPSLMTVFNWMGQVPDFLEQYARAQQARAETLADELQEIADQDPETVEVRDKEGNVIDIKVDNAFETWRKTRIDTRKWIASKLLPKRYGDLIGKYEAATPPPAEEVDLTALARKVALMLMVAGRNQDVEDV